MIRPQRTQLRSLAWALANSNTTLSNTISKWLILEVLSSTRIENQKSRRLTLKSVGGFFVYYNISTQIHRLRKASSINIATNPPALHSAKNSSESGFTLVELVGVLVLVGLLAVTAISRWDNSTISLSAQAEQIAGDIRYTQMISMTQGQRFRINFSSNRYWISNIDDSTQITHPATNSSDVFLNTGITLSSSNNYLVFNGNGVPYSTASLPGTTLNSNATITLTAGSETRSVEVRPETGRVSLL